MIPVHYDDAFFDQPIDRCNTACEKWDGIMAKEKQKLLPMWVADMDFQCPDEVVQAMVTRAMHPIYGYTEQTEASVEAMLSFVKRHDGITLTPDQQLTLPCVVTGLRSAVRTLTAPGDGVLVQPPVYGPFFDAVRDNDRVLVKNPLLRDSQGYYTMDFDGMQAAFQNGVKLMLLCSPHNPVGRVWTREELTRVYGLCKQYDVTLVSDEIHSGFVYAQGSFTSALALDEHTDAKLTVLTSASKTFNLAGLRQATLLTRNQAQKAGILRDMKSAGVVAGNIFSMVATEAAFRYGDEWLAALVRYLDKGRALLGCELAKRLPKAVMSPPEATYLAWIDLRAYGFTTRELMERTYAQGVAFSSGAFFDQQLGEGFLRFNFACPHSQTLEAVRRLEMALQTTTD